MELLLGTENLKYLAFGQYLHELIVILLLNLLDLDVELVLMLNGITAGRIVAGVTMAVAAHLVEQHTLLAQHLTIDREKGRCLLW